MGNILYFLLYYVLYTKSFQIFQCIKNAIYYGILEYTHYYDIHNGFHGFVNNTLNTD